MENDTRARCLDRKTNRENFTKIIDICNARLRNLKPTKKDSTGPGKKWCIAFVQSGEGRVIEISVHLNKFTAPMTSKEKTFAYLNRGSPFVDMFAISGYSQGDFGGVNRCLDREEWTAK